MIAPVGAAARSGPQRQYQPAVPGQARYWVSMKEIGTRRFVDRDIELARFARAVEDARHGTPAVLLVGGEAGIGKSSLVREGAARAGIASFVGRSVQVGGQPLPLS